MCLSVCLFVCLLTCSSCSLASQYWYLSVCLPVCLLFTYLLTYLFVCLFTVSLTLFFDPPTSAPRLRSVFFSDSRRPVWAPAVGRTPLPLAPSAELVVSFPERVVWTTREEQANTTWTISLQSSGYLLTLFWSSSIHWYLTTASSNWSGAKLVKTLVSRRYDQGSIRSVQAPNWLIHWYLTTASRNRLGVFRRRIG